MGKFMMGVASFIIRFAEHMIAGTGEKAAAHYLQLHLIGFLIGRFSGSFVMKRIAPSRLLSVFALGSLACLAVVLFATGRAPVWAVVLVGFFHSIMFPKIFALSIKNLRCVYETRFIIAGDVHHRGAIIPAVMGKISDSTNIQLAFVAPLICHAYILYFAIRGYKPSEVLVGRASI